MRIERFGIVLTLALASSLALGCRRESRRFEEDAWMSGGAAGSRVEDTSAAVPLPQGTAPGPYRGNAWAIGEGSRLYGQMNCVGCHAHGGGAMGPALMDGAWRYGSAPNDIFTTIVNGRPNGMPSYRGRLSDQQVWQLVAYVRSLSGLAPMDAAPSRDDHMNVRPTPVRTDKQPITHEDAPFTKEDGT